MGAAGGLIARTANSSLTWAEQHRASTFAGMSLGRRGHIIWSLCKLKPSDSHGVERVAPPSFRARRPSVVYSRRRRGGAAWTQRIGAMSQTISKIPRETLMVEEPRISCVTLPQNIDGRGQTDSLAISISSVGDGRECIRRTDTCTCSIPKGHERGHCCNR